jgi:thiamine pyrophosphokinase
MSSHHFVKEGQEPALIIANGQMCSYELLVSVMEWCPFMVVLDGAYSRVVELQITPDVVIGDFDSLPEIPQNAPTQFIRIADQETTDLDKALEYLVNKGYNDINIVWATGKRLDHTLNNFASLAKYPDHKIVLYDDHSKAFLLPKSFSKIYNAGDSLSLMPVHKATGICTHNLMYKLIDEELQYGQRSGACNQVLTTGAVTITHTSGTLALIESND